MNTTPIPVHLDVDRHVDRYIPLPSDTVRMPNAILQQVIQLGDLPSRKIFYILLAKDHLKEPERREYEIPYTDIYTSANNANKRGKEKKLAIRTGFQEKGFSISPSFVRVHLGRSADDPYVNAFSMVDYVDNKFVLTLTPEFKLYLHTLRKYKSDVPYTSGDLNLLLGMYHRAADKLYWTIRSMQFKKGTHRFATADLKALLGYEQTETRNFCSQTLASIEKELEGTWAEFRFEKVRKGKEIRYIDLAFDSDEVLRNKLKNDLCFEFESELVANGFKPYYAHYIRRLILKGEKTRTGRTWDAAYVLRTIKYALNKKRSSAIKDLPAYIFEALFEGYLEESLPTPSLNRYERLGKQTSSFQMIKIQGYSLVEVKREASRHEMTTDQYVPLLRQKTGRDFDWIQLDKGLYLYDKAELEEARRQLDWLETTRALGE